MKTVQSIVRATVALVLLILIAGCDPENLLVWSPDGSKAAVIGGSGMYVSDSEGKLGDLLIPHATQVAWLGNSGRVVAVLNKDNATWNDVEKVADASRKKQMNELADEIYKLAMSFNGDVKDLKNMDWLGVALGTVQIDDFLAVFTILSQKHGDELVKKYGEDWKKLSASKFNLTVVQVFEINGGTAKPGPVLGFSFMGVNDLRPSPDGANVAFTLMDSTSPGTCRLFVAPIDDRKPAVMLAGQCARFSDWSPDGRSLAYVRANLPRGDAKNALRLGSLHRQRICDEKGQLRSDLPIDEKITSVNDKGEMVEKDAPIDVLAGLIYSEWTKVRYMPDGGILFTSVKMSFPATTSDMPTRISLFGVTPGEKPVITPVLSDQTLAALPELVNQFELSPDGTRVVIPGQGNRISVVTLATGAVDQVRPADGGIELRMIPKWRNNDQICYAVTNASKEPTQRPGEMYLWSKATGEQVFSHHWPTDAVESLRTKSNEPQPTSQPQ